MSLQESCCLVCKCPASSIPRPCRGCIIGCSTACACFYGCSCFSKVAMCKAELHASQCLIHGGWLAARVPGHILWYLQTIKVQQFMAQQSLPV